MHIPKSPSWLKVQQLIQELEERALDRPTIKRYTLVLDLTPEREVGSIEVDTKEIRRKN